MIDGAEIKIVRAVDLISEVRNIILYRNPFYCVVQTNIISGERALRSELNVDVLSEVAVISGEIIHLIRSALDHAYWAVVSPVVAGDPGIEKKIQFPFAQSNARLEAELKNRTAEKVGNNFYKALVELRPHGGYDGNLYLYLIHALNIPDKHKHLIPIGEYKTINFDDIRGRFPDFPSYMRGSLSIVGKGRGDICWTTKNKLDISDIGQIVPPTTYLYSSKIDVKVDAVFSVAELDFRGEVISTLYKFVDVAREAIKVIREAAK